MLETVCVSENTFFTSSLTMCPNTVCLVAAKISQWFLQPPVLNGFDAWTLSVVHSLTLSIVFLLPFESALDSSFPCVLFAKNFKNPNGE